jgi:hypothetical protein
MVKAKFTSRYKSRFQGLHEIEEREVGKPKGSYLRSNPIVSGTLEYLVQPIFDFYAVAVATPVTKQTLFSLSIGQNYTPAGGAAIAKTIYHTNLVQNGMLDAPKKMLVKAIAIAPRGDIAAPDLASFIGLTLAQLFISGKDYWTSRADKCPGGAGPYGFYFSTQTLAAGGTMANLGANGWPSAQNVASIVDDMPQIPGLPAMEPILGQLIEQQQNFSVVLDPTITGAAAFTTLAAAPATQFVGTGVNVHVFLEGVLARAVL